MIRNTHNTEWWCCVIYVCTKLFFIKLKMVEELSAFAQILHTYVCTSPFHSHFCLF